MDNYLDLWYLFFSIFLERYFFILSPNKNISKEIFSLVLIGTGINLPWLSLNYLQHCNPLFPNLSELIGSCTYSSLQMQNIATMIKEATIWQNGTSWKSTHSLITYWDFSI